MKVHIITENNYLRNGLISIAEQCELTVNIINDVNSLGNMRVDDVVIVHIDRAGSSLFSSILRQSGKVNIILISSCNLNFDAICSISAIVSESVSMDHFISVLTKTTERHILINKNTPLLTLRERMVLVDILHGRSAYFIAKKLGLSYKTIYTHKLNAFKKLDAKNLHDVLLLSRLITLSSNNH